MAATLYASARRSERSAPIASPRPAERWSGGIWRRPARVVVRFHVSGPQGSGTAGADVMNRRSGFNYIISSTLQSEDDPRARQPCRERRQGGDRSAPRRAYGGAAATGTTPAPHHARHGSSRAPGAGEAPAC